ncbi:hypothetical protein K9U40_19985 [Xanthobacter autotrophicus]|uniref:hypothetical protein n=1 Tax=Xanthobacter TaxID=279 RepID=UPI0024AA4685|nr:hypothetical protein [Xanthobacter autotrophicus]MDI4666584.1 hypothetical protein [Xanthobacter autotrophicus]
MERLISLFQTAIVGGASGALAGGLVAGLLLRDSAFLGAIVGACATITAGWLALRGVKGQIEEMQIARRIEFTVSERERAVRELPGLREVDSFLRDAVTIPDEHIEMWSAQKYAHEFMNSLGFSDADQINYYDCDWYSLISQKIPDAPEDIKWQISQALYRMHDLDDVPNGSTDVDIKLIEEQNFKSAIRDIIAIHSSVEIAIFDAQDSIKRQREQSRNLLKRLRDHG